MNALKQVIKELNFTEDFQKLIFHQIKIPILDTYNPVWEYWYPHPPCLIPLFLGTGAEYTGLLHHFFCDRKQIFVDESLEWSYFSERASNEKQFVTLMILDMLEIEEELTEEIEQFCKDIHYSEDDLQKIVTYWDEYGYGKEHTSPLVYFTDRETIIPFGDIERSGYEGDFPASMNHIDTALCYNACNFEIEDINRITDLKNIPNWLREDTDKKALFYNNLSQNKLKEAWFTLNSKGWKLKDVAEALMQLRDKTNDKLFHQIADYWVYTYELSDCDETEEY